MVREFKLPDIGEGVHEGEVVKWFVAPGAPIRENDPMVEVMTDKVTVQIPSPFTGKVLELRAKEGEVVKVGSVLLVLAEEGEPETARPAAPPSSAPEPPRTEPGALTSAAGIVAAPSVRRLAKELGVDLRAVRGSGPGRRIVEADVRATKGSTPSAGPTMAPPSIAPTAASGSEQRIPIHGLRRRIHDRMAKSKGTAAHFTYVEEVDMTQLVHLRDRLKEVAEQKGIKLTFIPFVIKAVLASLRAFPTLNASVDDDRGELVVKGARNIGIATATAEGLTVTVVHDAEAKNLWELAREVDRLATAAREKSLSLHDVQGSTFTITSLGKEGGILATPIINWPEVAILGIHRIEKRPVVRNDQVAIREMMYVSCSFDHRVIDGHVGAAFVQAVKDYLEHPATIFVGSE
ncbi:MAG: hypothetical protein A3K68_02475 [Euryarchaeota archaeon RBG_16_68_13]|nr:MAG: hypothetical protein A3K68_02475 [Euryarchaeota archaeon RBG_16_68_13]